MPPVIHKCTDKSQSLQAYRKGKVLTQNWGRLGL